MKVYYDVNLESEEIRAHPWITASYDNANKYYDFKMNPDSIPEVLEDFKPWSNYRAIQLFYEFIRWLNGSDSLLESNDSAFKGPKKNIDKQFSKKLRCHGRVMLFYRKLLLNTLDDHMNWLRDAITFHLERLDHTFEWGMIGLTFLKIQYLELPLQESKQLGKLLQLSWWSYGDNEAETMANLERLFANLFEAIKHVSNEIKEALSKI